ncbi:hypothetical protein [Halovivax ruber]|uniref:hypothetical protein n=1 Tax=Halovivax ruber TaxID=387341 RepID=UPI0011E4FD7C|nr:hypothetical protein [Halovivax ruber]
MAIPDSQRPLVRIVVHIERVKSADTEPGSPEKQQRDVGELAVLVRVEVIEDLWAWSASSIPLRTVPP